MYLNIPKTPNNVNLNSEMNGLSVFGIPWEFFLGFFFLEKISNNSKNFFDRRKMFRRVGQRQKTNQRKTIWSHSALYLH